MRPSLRNLLQLYALPLSRTVPNKSPLFLLHAKKIDTSNGEALKNADGTPLSLPLVTRVTNKAADQWSKLGQADEGTWKKKAYVLGDRWMDRIEFEEWALKAIDPALSPKPWNLIKSGVGGAAEQRKKEKGEGKVELLYPKSLLEPESLLKALQKQVETREPHHKSAMYKCLAGAPLTLPFAIIPIVPNFPLFYVLWRAWSHWRAWKASQYLLDLLSSSQIVLVPSSAIDSIYKESEPSKLSPSSAPSSDSLPESQPSELLLTVDKVPRLVQALSLMEDERGELNRAVLQAQARLAQAEKKIKDDEETSGDHKQGSINEKSSGDGKGL